MPEDRSSISVQLNVAVGGDLYVVKDGDLHAEAFAGRGPAPALAALRAVSDKTVREIAYVLPPMPGHTAGVRLGDQLYVRRRIEGAVLRDVRARLAAVASGSGERPKATAILGDPGYGKSWLLWWLHRELGAGADVFLVPAAALTAREPAGLGPSRLLAGLEEAASSGPAVLLLDTADVLLHRSSDVATLVKLLSRLPDLGIPTVVASRTAKAALLEQEYRGGLDSLAGSRAGGTSRTRRAGPGGYLGDHPVPRGARLGQAIGGGPVVGRAFGHLAPGQAGRARAHALHTGPAGAPAARPGAGVPARAPGARQGRGGRSPT